MELRSYQKEIIDIIDNLNSGSYLVQLATGLGKTVTFANIKRKGRVLVLAHREELVTQPIKYYDIPVGIEMRELKSKGEEVVIASVQSLVRRLNKFNKDDFDMIITDECHHSIAKPHKKYPQSLQLYILAILFCRIANKDPYIKVKQLIKTLIRPPLLLYSVRCYFLLFSS